MILYHFTAAANLRAIAKHGLTIGDVPTDFLRARGRVGVWLTTSQEPTGHGLDQVALGRNRYRLTVNAPPSPALVRWSEWAPGNVEPATIENLKECAGMDGASQWRTWFVCFDAIPPEAIDSCLDTLTGREVEDWSDLYPAELSTPAVRAGRRHAWHDRVMKRFALGLRVAKARGLTVSV